MKPRTVIILVGIVVFAAAVLLALLREVEREEELLQAAISGTVEVSNEMRMTGQADIDHRADRMALMLIEPQSGEAVALQYVSPISPPQAISIGQQHARGDRTLSGDYYVMGITDKDGDVTKVTRGEVFGRTPNPVPLGTEQLRLLLDQPFRGKVPPLAPDTPTAGGGREGSY